MRNGPERGTKEQIMVKFSELRIDAVISYRLPLSYRPAHPDRLWHGIILTLYPATQVVKVQLLDEGYEQDTEHVSLEQIVEID